MPLNFQNGLKKYLTVSFGWKPLKFCLKNTEKNTLNIWT